MKIGVSAQTNSCARRYSRKAWSTSSRIRSRACCFLDRSQRWRWVEQERGPVLLRGDRIRLGGVHHRKAGGAQFEPARGARFGERRALDLDGALEGTGAGRLEVPGRDRRLRHHHLGEPGPVPETQEEQPAARPAARKPAPQPHPGFPPAPRRPPAPGRREQRGVGGAAARPGSRVLIGGSGFGGHGSGGPRARSGSFAEPFPRCKAGRARARRKRAGRERVRNPLAGRGRRMRTLECGARPRPVSRGPSNPTAPRGDGGGPGGSGGGRGCPAPSPAMAG